MLPFVANPKLKLAPNKEIKAIKTYYQQLRNLNKNAEDKAKMLDLDAKLQKLGYVEYLHGLPVFPNYIPWWFGWKETSVSASCRIVFDASSPTATGYSLNELFTVILILCFYNKKFSFDGQFEELECTLRFVKYNTTQLYEKHWRYQRYVRQKDLYATKIESNQDPYLWDKIKWK